MLWNQRLSNSGYRDDDVVFLLPRSYEDPARGRQGLNMHAIHRTAPYHAAPEDHCWSCHTVDWQGGYAPQVTAEKLDLHTGYLVETIIATGVKVSGAIIKQNRRMH